MTFDIQDAINERAENGGGLVTLPPGETVLTGPLYIPDTAAPISLVGAVPGTFGSFSGSVLDASAVDGDAITVDGQAHTLSSFRLKNSNARGIVWRASQGQLFRVTVDHCADSGIYFVSSGGDQSWGTLVFGCRSASNVKHGFATEGASCGLNSFFDCDARANGQAGYFEGAYLINYYAMCHSATNLYSYYVDGDANYSSFVGCYAENGQMHYLQNAKVFGGTLELQLLGTTTPRFGTHSYVKAHEHGRKATLPGRFGPIETSTDERGGHYWTIGEDYAGSFSWLKNCRLPLHYERSAYAALAITDERHPAGPGLLQRGAPSYGTKFRTTLSQDVTATSGTAVDVVFGHAAFDDKHLGKPVQFTQVTGGLARILGSWLDREAGTFTVRVGFDEDATVTVDVLTERWL